jgi:hypothetical protein
MKYLFLLFMAIPSISEAQFEKINADIFKQQKRQEKITPFKTFGGNIRDQKKYRLEVLNNELNIAQKNDTIYLIESYPYECSNCPSTKIYLLLDLKLVQYSRDWTDENRWSYTRKEEFLSRNLVSNTGYFFDDLKEIRDLTRSSERWNKNPEKFGTDNCFDGSHTFYTVIYPDSQVETMYIRCWIPKHAR